MAKDVKIYNNKAYFELSSKKQLRAIQAILSGECTFRIAYSDPVRKNGVVVHSDELYLQDTPNRQYIKQNYGKLTNNGLELDLTLLGMGQLTRQIESALEKL